MSTADHVLFTALVQLFICKMVVQISSFHIMGRALQTKNAKLLFVLQNI